MIATALDQEGNARSMPRTNLMLSAMIRFDGISAKIRLRDLSAGGARLEAAILPAVGKTVHISRGELHASGTILWRNRKECGLRFDVPLPLDAWIPARGARHQSVVGAMVEAVRSGEAAMLPVRPPPQSPEAFRTALSKRLAEELAYVVRLLESLGDDLCAEPLLVMRHAEKLQNLDISAQILSHVGALLVAQQPEQAVDEVGMGSLRKRLQRVSL
ncbi:MAG: PilZ domain-containing protein [Sphingomonas bacterium]|nr:PilZ domain-containing protein [Sphingomonas bacterium]